jgi:hypothetical protein
VFQVAEVIQAIQFSQDTRHPDQMNGFTRNEVTLAQIARLTGLAEKDTYAKVTSLSPSTVGPQCLTLVQSLKIEPRDANEAIEAFLQVNHLLSSVVSVAPF